MRELKLLRGANGEEIRVISGVAFKWKDLGYRLFKNDDVIKQIQREYPHLEDACERLLERWLRGEGNSSLTITWGTLVRAIKEIEMTTLAGTLNTVLT